MRLNRLPTLRDVSSPPPPARSSRAAGRGRGWGALRFNRAILVCGSAPHPNPPHHLQEQMGGGGAPRLPHAHAPISSEQAVAFDTEQETTMQTKIRYLAFLSETPDQLADFYARHLDLKEMGRSIH